MTREEAIEVLNGIEEVHGTLPEDGNKIEEALSMAIKALEQEPCEDAISRSAAIKAIDERAKRIKNEDTLNGLAGAVGVLFDLPPVKPQPTGYWVAVVDKWGDIVTTVNGYKCSECGEFNGFRDKFCPNCGAKMVEPQESEVRDDR